MRDSLHKSLSGRLQLHRPDCTGEVRSFTVLTLWYCVRLYVQAPEIGFVPVFLTLGYIFSSAENSVQKRMANGAKNRTFTLLLLKNEPMYES